MASLFIKEQFIIPVAHAESANRLADIFDFDRGGRDTFGMFPLSPTGKHPATHYLAHTVIKPHYLVILSNPDLAMVALTKLAKEYNRPRPRKSDVEDFCSHVIIGEPVGLLPITED